MNSNRILRTFGICAVAGVVLTGCAETRFVMHTAKRLGETNKEQGNYKVGEPYEVDGVWYYPAEEWDYDDTGIASWYGPNFHGKATANGEVFDQWSVSAAHKTLPMPSLVRVTNLDNGRSLVVRVNDRGPFKPGRIIDMSRRGAQLLGFEDNGTARVRVQILARESQSLAGRAQVGGTELAQADAPIKAETVAREPVVSQALPEPGAQPAPQPQPTTITVKTAAVEQGQAETTRLYIQAGAFSDVSNAQRVKNRLSGIGTVNITPVPVNGKELFRVRLGPIDDVNEADRLLAQVFEAGYAGARTVVVKSVD